MNLFDTEPQVTVPVTLDQWKCPVTGFVVPKTLKENLALRSKLIRKAAKDPDLQKQLMAACKQSFLLWVNLFCYTETFFSVDDDGVTHNREDKWQPFISWPKQDELLQTCFDSAVDGKPLLVEKSREIGATWCMVYLLVYRFLFGSNVQMSMLAMKEDDVDNISGDITSYPHGIVSDPSTLFGKVDYVLRYLPAWMLPSMARKRLHLVNRSTRCRIDGGASGNFAFSGQRRDILLFDEAAKIETFESVWEGTTDVAKCRIPISTPVGLGTYFTKLRNSGHVPVFEFGWWAAPDKSRDLEFEELPNKKYRLTSSWYRQECAKRSPNDIAANLDINHIDSGTAFFETSILDSYKKKMCVPHLLNLRIEFRDDVPETYIPGALATMNLSKIKVTQDPKGPWKLWFRPSNENKEAKDGEFKFIPSLGQQLVFGVDVSMGQGASNSVCSVLAKIKRDKIAEFADANCPPHSFAKLVAAACIYFSGGGGSRPLVIPEVNGIPGVDFMRQFSTIYRYQNIYKEKTNGPIGFHSSRPKKATLLGNLRRAYAVGNYTNPSALSLDEAISYIIYPSGTIGPAFLMRESADASMTHGDRCIADALSLWPGNEIKAMEEQAKSVKIGDSFDPKKAPNGSAGWRYFNRDKLSLHSKPKRLEDIKVGEKWDIRDFV